MELTQVVGGSIVAWAALQAARTAYGTWLRQRADNKQRRRARESFARELEAARERHAHARTVQAPAWQGHRQFVVSRKVREAADDICSFYLVPQDGHALPGFLPGQYLTFGLRTSVEGQPLVRCYSVSDEPRAEYYRVTIKKIPPPGAQPNLSPGRCSSFFHAHVQAGSVLDVQAPRGGFTLDLEQTTPVVFVAGGIGVTPLLSMLLGLARRGDDRPAWFFYGLRNSRQHVMREELRRVVREHPNIRLTVCYSDPLPEDVVGQTFDHAGHVDLELLKRTLPAPEGDFFVCGPPPMMSAVTQGLESWGVAADQIHFEAFGAATVRRAHPAAGQATAEERGYSVTFARSGKSGTWTSTTGSLLALAEDQGVALESGCRAGNCGTCETSIKSGNVSYPSPPGAQPAAGTCLTCVAVPSSDLVLDA